MKRFTHFLAVFFCVFNILSLILYADTSKPLIYDTWHDSESLETNLDAIIKEEVILELCASPTVQRLKKINQYGASRFTIKPYHYTRYEHSLRVMLLVRHFGGSLLEQIAALLHDVSHTVFSHVAEHFFKHRSEKDSYQDSMHEWFLNQTEIPEILRTYGITLAEVLHKNNEFKCLEQSLPNVCADRLEYVLHGALLENKATKDDIDFILNHVHFNDGMWWFDNVDAADRLGRMSLYLSKEVFGSCENDALYHLVAQAMQRAVALEYIPIEMIYFSDDATVWNLLKTSNDKSIQKIMHHINELNTHIMCMPVNDADLHFFPKFRGIDPLVMTDEGVKRLTELDPEYSQEFDRIKKTHMEGNHLIIQCHSACINFWDL